MREGSRGEAANPADGGQAAVPVVDGNLDPVRVRPILRDFRRALPVRSDPSRRTRRCANSSSELTSQSCIWWQTTADEAYWQLSTSLEARGIPYAIMAMRAPADPREGTVTLKSEWDHRYMQLQSFTPSIYPEMEREANETLLPQVERLCREWQTAQDAPLEAIRLDLVDEMERTRRAAGVGEPQRKHLRPEFGPPEPVLPLRRQPAAFRQVMCISLAIDAHFRWQTPCVSLSRTRRNFAAYLIVRFNEVVVISRLDLLNTGVTRARLKKQLRPGS